MRRWAALVGIAMTVLFAAVPSVAHSLYHSDADDTDGLDLMSVRLRVVEHRDTEYVSGKAVFFEDIPGEDGSLVVDFDSRGDERGDYALTIAWDPASAGVYTRAVARLNGDVVGYARVRFDWGDVIRFNFPESWIRTTKHIRWRVASSSESGAHDLAPDSGWFEH